MPTVAKLTALVVTSTIVFGTDSDVLRAVPLGLLAGVLTTTFVTLIDSIQAQEHDELQPA